MSQLDLLKLFQKFGEETELADFSPEELQQLLYELENGDGEQPITAKSFKEKYFDFYDDVKDKSLNKQDW